MDDELYQKLLGFTLNYVSIRPRSEHELRSYILKKINRWKASPEFLDGVMDRLGELGYVDDQKFALAFIDSRNRFRPKGAMLLRAELKKKGVDEECIETALKLSMAGEGGNEAGLARIAAVKKLRALQHYPVMERRNKLYSFLVRRGFSGRVISSVIDELTRKGLQ